MPTNPSQFQNSPSQGKDQPAPKNQADRWQQVFQEMQPTAKDHEAVKEFNFFGKQMITAETYHNSRRKAGIALKGVSQGAGGVFGDLLSFAQGVVGVKKPLHLLPTSGDVGKFFEKMAGEKFEPKTGGEKILHRTSQGLGTILVTGNPMMGGARNPAQQTVLRQISRTAMSAFVPAGVSVYAEKQKLPPWMQVAATVGSGLALNAVQGGNLNNIKRGLYQEANQIAGNRTVSAYPIIRHMNALERDLQRGGATAAKTAVQGMINDFRAQVQRGTIPVRNLTEFRRNIHERMRDVQNVRGSEIYWNRFREGIDGGINHFGRTNPRFNEVYRYANGIHRGQQESGYLRNFIMNNPTTSAVGGLFTKLMAPSIGLPTLGTAAVLTQVANSAVAFARNPALRRAYWQVLREGVQRDVRGTAHALNVFNKIWEKEEKKNPDMTPKEED